MSVSTMDYGIAGQPAPEFRFDTWLNSPNNEVALADVDALVGSLYHFQSWCPGCDSDRFPALAAVKAHFDTAGRSDQVRFIALQMVFEGYDDNTEQAVRESMECHGLSDIALGHDASSPPTIMADYRTGGTHWSVLIGPDRTALADGFQIDAEAAIESLINEVNYPTGETL
jgi:thiol-disulfide isomerase/thioredoxin